MSLTTFFQFAHTSYLPLPPTATQRNAKAGYSPQVKLETVQEIQARGKRTAVKLLHSPELMIMLNPLVQHYSRVDPADPANEDRLVDLDTLALKFNVALANPLSCSSFADSKNGEFVHYEIIDKFQFLGGLASKLLTYRACFRPLYDVAPHTLPNGQPRESQGLETISDPGNGVSLLGKWVVSEDNQKPGFLVLTETVQVHCNVFLSWYVRGQLESAHAQLHKEFGRHFCESMVAEDPMKGQDERVGKTWKEIRRSESAGSYTTTTNEVGNKPLDRMRTE
ncbi:hypothetical protein LTS08_004004 [Lithohypha guttulata]|uniref:uncharacterized protein n=1 Tax=Lithohypha guttulata TaxID=1690604 RepID=UPI002DE07D23|nr:hypothetical protein LTR51_001036 [Lithohypha guttulata]KAK5103199.1 hypothetical protein LTS08_004004 [Lithohypha guttulata]